MLNLYPEQLAGIDAAAAQVCAPSCAGQCPSNCQYSRLLTTPVLHVLLVLLDGRVLPLLPDYILSHMASQKWRSTLSFPPRGSMHIAHFVGAPATRYAVPQTAHVLYPSERIDTTCQNYMIADANAVSQVRSERPECRVQAGTFGALTPQDRQELARMKSQPLEDQLCGAMSNAALLPLPGFQNDSAHGASADAASQSGGRLAANQRPDGLSSLDAFKADQCKALLEPLEGHPRYTKLQNLHRWVNP